MGFSDTLGHGGAFRMIFNRGTSIWSTVTIRLPEFEPEDNVFNDKYGSSVEIHVGVAAVGHPSEARIDFFRTEDAPFITQYPTLAPTGAPTVTLQADIPNFNCTYPNWGVNCNMTATSCSDGTCVLP